MGGTVLVSQVTRGLCLGNRAGVDPCATAPVVWVDDPGVYCDQTGYEIEGDCFDLLSRILMLQLSNR